MLALEHLHANALLVVLLGGALAIVSLRVAVYLLHRSLVATDRKVMSLVSSVGRSQRRLGRTSEESKAPSDRRSHADAPGASAARPQTSAHFTHDAQADQLTETYQDTEQRPDSKS
jgi:hypothetical protein